MERSRAFFLEEARECLIRLGRDLPPNAGRAEIEARYRAARLIRGGAHLGRYGVAMKVAAELEQYFGNALDRDAPSAPATERVEELVGALERAIAAIERGEVEPDMELDMENETGTEQRFVALDELEYIGAAALERAAELRTPLEDAIVSEEPAGPILDELFDLIRLGMR